MIMILCSYGWRKVRVGQYSFVSKSLPAIWAIPRNISLCKYFRWYVNTMLVEPLFAVVTFCHKIRIWVISWFLWHPTCTIKIYLHRLCHSFTRALSKWWKLADWAVSEVHNKVLPYCRVVVVDSGKIVAGTSIVGYSHIKYTVRNKVLPYCRVVVVDSGKIVAGTSIVGYSHIKYTTIPAVFLPTDINHVDFQGWEQAEDEARYYGNDWRLNFCMKCVIQVHLPSVAANVRDHTPVIIVDKNDSTNSPLWTWNPESCWSVGGCRPWTCGKFFSNNFWPALITESLSHWCGSMVSISLCEREYRWLCIVSSGPSSSSSLDTWTYSGSTTSANLQQHLTASYSSSSLCERVSLSLHLSREMASCGYSAGVDSLWNVLIESLSCYKGCTVHCWLEQFGMKCVCPPFSASE